jgi:hypothetical protein
MTITIKVETQIPIKTIAYELCTALEQGSGYWASWDGVVSGGTVPPDLADDQIMADYFRLANGGKIKIREYEDGYRDRGPMLELTAAKIRAGLTRMAQNHPKHFADLVAEDGDASTADVFLQYCLLGEIRYG